MQFNVHTILEVLAGSITETSAQVDPQRQLRNIVLADKTTTSFNEDTLYICDHLPKPLPRNIYFLYTGKGDISNHNVIKTHNLTMTSALNALGTFLAKRENTLETLRRLYLVEGNINQFCTLIAETLNNPVVLYDDNLFPVCQTPFPERFSKRFFHAETVDVDYVLSIIPTWMQEGNIFNRTEAYRISNFNGTGMDSAVCNVMDNSEMIGCLELFQVAKEISETDMAFLKQACDILALSAHTARAILGNNRVATNLLQGDFVLEAVRCAWVKSLKWKNTDIYVAYILFPEEFKQSPQSVRAITRTLGMALPSTVCTEVEGNPVCIANCSLDSPQATIQTIQTVLGQSNISLRIGISEVIQDFGRIDVAFSHAQFAAEAAREQEQVSVCYSDCRFAFFSKLCQAKEIGDSLIDEAVARMFADDSHENTENVQTLKTYIECGFSLNTTAKKLAVHRNTVSYRLQKIEELYSIDLQPELLENDTVFSLLLSCKLLLDLPKSIG